MCRNRGSRLSRCVPVSFKGAGTAAVDVPCAAPDNRNPCTLNGGAGELIRRVSAPGEILVMALHFLKLYGACGTTAFAFVLPLLSVNAFGAGAGVIGKGGAAAQGNQHKVAH